MPVTKFGNKRGPEKGDRGDSGMLSTTFFPQISKWFNENMSFLCYFDDLVSGFVYEEGKKIGIRNQNGKNHALSNDIGQLIKYKHSKKYSLEFKEESYKIHDISWALGGGMKTIILLNFKVDAFPTGLEYILSTQRETRKIYLKGANLIIDAGERVVLKYRMHRWNILFVEFSNMLGTSTFWFNEEIGYFKTDDKLDDDVLYLGGKGEKYFLGCIGRVGIYSAIQSHVENLQESVRDLILEDLKLL